MGYVEMVVAIVAIVMIAGVLKARYEHQQRPDPVEDADAVRAREEIRNLKERIAVLERVITDTNSASNLDREIDRLRDRDR